MEHSVELIKDKCIGCTDCIKRCPTEAIRVREGKATIISEYCVDCGLCIKVCQNHAKQAVTDKLSMIRNYSYKVALPAPTLYGQFKNLTDTNILLTALKNLGFDDVFEVSKAAELVTEAAAKYIAENKLKKPIISSACPAVVRLICMKYPSLIGNLLPIIPPIEVAAHMARDTFAKKNNVLRDEIGVFFISPCAAKATYARMPLGIKQSDIDGIISIESIFKRLTNMMSGLTEVEILAEGGSKGMDWALTGGESSETGLANAIAVDGIENVINVLEEVENGQLDVDFIEALACTGGCVGGPLTAVNNFVAKTNLRKLERSLEEKPIKTRTNEYNGIDFMFSKKLDPAGVLKMQDDLAKALERMEQVETIYDTLPKIDCGSCGSPTCKALAEDIVRGMANTEDCVFMLRKKVKELAELMVNLAAKMPQTIGSGAENTANE